MFLIVSCVILWRPPWKHSWRASFAFRSGCRFQYDQQKLVGTVSTDFLLVIAFTGVYMKFPSYFQAAIGAFVVSRTDGPQVCGRQRSASVDSRRSHCDGIETVP